MKLAVLDDYQHVALAMADWSVLEGDAEITVFNRHLGGLQEAAAALQGFHIIAAMRERTPFPRALFEGLPDLRLLVTTGARNAAIDLDAARDHGVVVCGTSLQSRATAELTWGLILAAARHIAYEDRMMRAGQWQTTVGFDLAGRTLGLMGLGRQGAMVAEIGQAFRMRLIAWSQNLTAARAAECGAERVDKDELLARADVLTIHLKRQHLARPHRQPG
jgi:phosphoglycerate dehydrogenase-like enzyme